MHGPACIFWANLTPFSLEGGHAIAATLLGDVSPAGRTAVTWYSRSSDIPRFGYMGWYPNATEGSKGRSYRFFEGAPQFAFGFGLRWGAACHSCIALHPCAPIFNAAVVALRVEF